MGMATICMKPPMDSGTKRKRDRVPFLLKTEPDKYSFDDLVRDAETTWDGISNNQALLYLRGMKKGEKLVIYHSNIGKAAVGTREGGVGRCERCQESEGSGEGGQEVQGGERSWRRFARRECSRIRSCSGSSGCRWCRLRRSSTTGWSLRRGRGSLCPSRDEHLRRQ